MQLIKSISYEFGVFILKHRILIEHTVKERTAISLLKLDEFYSYEAIKLSRKDHSSLIGTTVESLIRALQDFKKNRNY